MDERGDDESAIVVDPGRAPSKLCSVTRSLVKLPTRSTLVESSCLSFCRSFCMESLSAAWRRASTPAAGRRPVRGSRGARGRSGGLTRFDIESPRGAEPGKKATCCEFCSE